MRFAMNKSFYISGLLFLALATVTQLFAGILYFSIGGQWAGIS